jgi:hypothetical protein
MAAGHILPLFCPEQKSHKENASIGCPAPAKWVRIDLPPG